MKHPLDNPRKNQTFTSERTTFVSALGMTPIFKAIKLEKQQEQNLEDFNAKSDFLHS